jgi:hypothetical protein
MLGPCSERPSAGSRTLNDAVLAAKRAASASQEVDIEARSRPGRGADGGHSPPSPPAIDHIAAQSATVMS